MTNKTKYEIYNLVFPDGKDSIQIGPLCFEKHQDYRQMYKHLSHYVKHHSPRGIANVTTGTHQNTAFLNLEEEPSHSDIFSGSEIGLLDDAILLLSLFTLRDVFRITESENEDVNSENLAIVADSRSFVWGGVVQCSLKYEIGNPDDEPIGHYEIGFEKELNRMLTLIRSVDWKDEYRNGHFLILYKSMILQRTIESAFIQSWTIWEHLFSVLNDKWLSEKALRNTKAVEKISFLLTKYAFKLRLGAKDHERLNKLARIRNRLIHFGMVPDTNGVINDAIMFIRMTEFLVAKTLGLEPSNLFNTVEKFEEFLTGQQQKSIENNRTST